MRFRAIKAELLTTAYCYDDDVILKMPIVCIQSSQNIKKVYNINFTKTGSAIYVFQVTIKSIQNNQSVNFNVWKTRTKR